MCETFRELQCKEVICLRDGRRLGFVCDAKLQLPEGNILALIVPGPCKFWGLWGHKEDFVIPWHCIRRIGPDIILVDVKPEECRIPCKKGGWF
jgi:YlmC/YmxH family sporulation protein